MTHSLDMWHKACKLTAKRSAVSYMYMPAQFLFVLINITLTSKGVPLLLVLGNKITNVLSHFISIITLYLGHLFHMEFVTWDCLWNSGLQSYCMVQRKHNWFYVL